MALGIGINTIFFTISDTTVDSSTNRINPIEKKPNYPVNEQGQTYGNAPFPAGPANEPDLILAEGENEVVGFVKSSDLNSGASSPTEAMDYQESMKSVGYKALPLYKEDGKTVIGEFRMYYTNGD